MYWIKDYNEPGSFINKHKESGLLMALKTLSEVRIEAEVYSVIYFNKIPLVSYNHLTRIWK